MSGTETETTTTETTSSTESEGLSRDEVRSLIGEVFDEKFNAIKGELGSGINLDEIKTSLLPDIEGLIEKHKSQPDNQSLLREVDNLLGKRLQGVGANLGRKVGPLGRWLAGTDS